MNKVVRLMTLSAAFLLSACASMYTQPQANTAHATVQGSEVRDSLFTWRLAAIDSIDNKAINTFMSRIPKLRIAPGRHGFVTMVTFRRGFTSGEYYALVPFTADIKPGQAYVIKSAINGVQAQAWLEDSLGRRVAIGSANYNILAQDNTTTVIPVIINTHHH